MIQFEFENIKSIGLVLFPLVSLDLTDKIVLSDAQLFAPLEDAGIKNLHLAPKFLHFPPQLDHISRLLSFLSHFLLELFHPAFDSLLLVYFHLLQSIVESFLRPFIPVSIHHFKSYKISYKMQGNPSFTGSKIFGNYTTISRRQLAQSQHRPNSLRQSQRKPIFDKNMYLTSVTDYALKRPLSYKEEETHVRQVTWDDFCGCQHNLDPCSHIQELLKGLNEKDMRKEYDDVDAVCPKKSKLELNRKYFRYLPGSYPELYHAQLANILSNLGREISFNEFSLLASIEYHAKLEHLSYFLFTDLSKSLKSKKKFMDTLQLSLIKHEINYSQLLQQSRIISLPLDTFMNDYYQSAAAIVVPLSQYAVFLSLLLQQGSKIKLKLIIFLMVKKRDSLLWLVKCYNKSMPYLREQSRQLPWELFLEELKEFK